MVAQVEVDVTDCGRKGLFTCGDRKTCLKSHLVCNGKVDCPNDSYDEEHCGCEQIPDDPIDVIIAMDMSVSIYKLQQKLNENVFSNFKSFAQKLVERLNINKGRAGPSVGTVFYGDKNKMIHTADQYGFMSNFKHSKTKVLTKIRKFKRPDPRKGWTKPQPWKAAAKLANKFKHGTTKLLIMVMAKNEKNIKEKEMKKLYSLMSAKKIKIMTIGIGEDGEFDSFADHDPLDLNYHFGTSEVLLQQDIVDQMIDEACEAISGEEVTFTTVPPPLPQAKFSKSLAKILNPLGLLRFLPFLFTRILQV